jgi:hypothetical protein
MMKKMLIDDEEQTANTNKQKIKAASKVIYFLTITYYIARAKYIYSKNFCFTFFLRICITVPTLPTLHGQNVLFSTSHSQLNRPTNKHKTVPSLLTFFLHSLSDTTPTHTLSPFLHYTYLTHESIIKKC